MNKLEKLKEVNLQLANVLKELEARMFIENTVDVQYVEIIDDEPKVVIELK
jgi:hypothetical protein